MTIFPCFAALLTRRDAFLDLLPNAAGGEGHERKMLGEEIVLLRREVRIVSEMRIDRHAIPTERRIAVGSARGRAVRGEEDDGDGEEGFHFLALGLADFPWPA